MNGCGWFRADLGGQAETKDHQKARGAWGLRQIKWWQSVPANQKYGKRRFGSPLFILRLDLQMSSPHKSSVANPPNSKDCMSGVKKVASLGSSQIQLRGNLVILR